MPLQKMHCSSLFNFNNYLILVFWGISWGCGGKSKGGFTQNAAGARWRQCTHSLCTWYQLRTATWGTATWAARRVSIFCQHAFRLRPPRTAPDSAPVGAIAHLLIITTGMTASTSKCKRCLCSNSRHRSGASSLLSKQSLSPSHFQRSWMQRLFLQANSPAWHWGGGTYDGLAAQCQAEGTQKQ